MIRSQPLRSRVTRSRSRLSRSSTAAYSPRSSRAATASTASRLPGSVSASRSSASAENYPCFIHGGPSQPFSAKLCEMRRSAAGMKQGWFSALALLREALTDPGSREAVDAVAARLERGEYAAVEERLNLERDLVTRLRSGCERIILGYTVKREYFNTAFEPGIENIAYDSQSGLNSPLFIRTAKLKDFPWNGWLRIGVASAPRAAWNPVGGFTDPAGRLIWSAVGDSALLPAPYGNGWVLNRVADVRAAPRRMASASATICRSRSRSISAGRRRPCSSPSCSSASSCGARRAPIAILGSTCFDGRHSG